MLPAPIGNGDTYKPRRERARVSTSHDAEGPGVADPMVPDAVANRVGHAVLMKANRSLYRILIVGLAWLVVASCQPFPRPGKPTAPAHGNTSVPLPDAGQPTSQGNPQRSR
jgi:hypothetical protein